MAFLKPDKTYTKYGLTIKEKLITSSTGVKAYSNRKLNTTNHKPEYITIHNTADINEAVGTNDAEQYSRATFNNAMGDVVVHYYIDETDCWHILANDTVGWHAADGSNGPGNTKSIAIEIIMDGSGKDYDVKAEDRGALLAAILLNEFNLGIDKLKTHHDWYSKKYCPAYILPHWDKFVKKVETNLNMIKAQNAKEKTTTTTQTTTTIKLAKNYLTYPTKTMNITQNYTNSYSHATHSQGNPKDYPIDDACSDGGREYFYCPCNEMMIAHIYGVNNSYKTNTIWLQSTSKVVGPFGEDYVTILITHPEDDDLSKLKEGQKFTRGQAIFREGKDGNATGYHFHIAVGTGKFTGSGWVQNSKKAWVNNTTGKQLKPEEAFYIDPKFTTIKNSNGITFKNLPTAATTTTTTTTKTTTTDFYRIRKSWADTKSQVGAYANLASAKAQRDKMGDGYFVYDSKGNQVYPAKNTTPAPIFKPYIAKVTALGLYIWLAPDKNHGHKGMVYKGQVFTIVEEKNGFGKLKSGAGWLDLTYLKKV